MKKETRELVNVYFTRISTRKKKCTEHKEGGQEPERMNEKENGVPDKYEAR